MNKQYDRILSDSTNIGTLDRETPLKRKSRVIESERGMHHQRHQQGDSSMSDDLRRKVRNISNQVHFGGLKKGYSHNLGDGELGHSSIQRDAELVGQNEELVTNLNTRLMILQTQKVNQEFEKYKLEDELIHLKERLKVVREDMKEIKQHEQESLQSLQEKFELKRKEAKVMHESKLEELKEKVSKDIGILIDDSIKKSQIEKSRLVSECDELKKQIKSQDQELNRKLIKLKEDHNRKLIQLETSLAENVSGLEESIKLLQEETLKNCQEKKLLEERKLKALDSECRQLLIQLEASKSKFHENEVEFSNIRDQITCMQHSHEIIQSHFQEKEKRIIDIKTRCKEAKEKMVKFEEERRFLHNKLQSLKGNIRVYCRIRPPITNFEKLNDNLTTFKISECITRDGSEELIVSGKDIRSTSHLKDHAMKQIPSYTFQFDKVFSTKSSNEEIFSELSQLIQSSLDGYNVCVFAYGQTGSGKTWTMAGEQNSMIPLSINKIFNDIGELTLKGWEYHVEGEFLEIYNESIIDLLAPSNSEKIYSIKHDDVNNTTSVTNLISINLKSKEQAISVFEKAALKRSTATTDTNSRSSRSHSIFRLKLRGFNTQTKESSEGVLNLVDLAGSERLSSSHATGERLKETQSINKSLSSLGDVIYALGQQKNGQSQSHIPYRNSKLTYLLKNSLGGDSKTLMFVNVSPALSNLNETINSLRFAAKVSNTKLGKRRNSK